MSKPHIITIDQLVGEFKTHLASDSTSKKSLVHVLKINRQDFIDQQLTSSTFVVSGGEVATKVHTHLLLAVIDYNQR